MGVERYPLLLLLATIAVHGPTASVYARSPMFGEPADVTSDVVGTLRASVQDRIATVQLSIPAPEDNNGLKKRLAQWFNFPNFFNQGCFRGYWRNC
jgi:hypothetical protein